MIFWCWKCNRSVFTWQLEKDLSFEKVYERRLKTNCKKSQLTWMIGELDWRLSFCAELQKYHILRINVVHRYLAPKFEVFFRNILTFVYSFSCLWMKVIWGHTLPLQRCSQGISVSHALSLIYYQMCACLSEIFSTKKIY